MTTKNAERWRQVLIWNNFPLYYLTKILHTSEQKETAERCSEILYCNAKRLTKSDLKFDGRGRDAKRTQDKCGKKTTTIEAWKKTMTNTVDVQAIQLTILKHTTNIARNLTSLLGVQEFRILPIERASKFWRCECPSGFDFMNVSYTPQFDVAPFRKHWVFFHRATQPVQCLTCRIPSCKAGKHGCPAKQKMKRP